MILKILKIYIVFLFISMPQLLLAYQLELKSYLDRQTITLDENFVIYVEIKGDIAKNDLTLPLLENFLIVKGEKYNYFLESKMDSKQNCIVTVFRYLIEPLVEGDFLIGPFILKDNVQGVVRSNRNHITVNKSEGSYKKYQNEILYSTSDIDKIKSDFSLQITFSKNTLYEGQQLLVQFDFVRPQGVTLMGLKYNYPTFENFIKEVLPTEMRPVIVTRNNNQCFKETALFAVFPLTGQELNINDASVSFIIMLYDKAKDEYVPQEIVIEANNVSANIRPLPLDTKINTSLGVLDDVTVQISENKSVLALDQAMEITIDITAKGLLQKNDFKITKEEDAFLEFLISDNIETAIDNKNNIISKRLIKKKIIPTKAGKFRLNQEKYFYFSPTAKDYLSINSREIELTVKDKTEKQASPLVPDKTDGAVPNKTKVQLTTEYLNPLVLGLVLLGIFFLIFLIAWGVKAKSEKAKDKKQRNPIQRSGQNKHRRL